MRDVRVYAIHDARTVARIAGADPPTCESLALSVEDPSKVLFSFMGGNPLASNWLAELDLPGDRITCWSGSLAPEAIDDDGLFTADPRNWMSPGTEALDAFLDGVVQPLERSGRTLCLLPHARHVLSDVQGSINLVRSRAGQPVEVALAPIALLTPSMLEALEDHLERSFDTLSEHAPFLLLHDAIIDTEEERLIPAPLGSGIIEKDILLSMIERHWPTEKPVVLLAENLPAQLEWLGTR